MTEEKQNLAIAKFRGFNTEKRAKQIQLALDEGANPGADPWPNYLGDLNEMHKAENALTDKQHSKYRKKLLDVCGGLADALCATSRQRAEAFLKTLNLWEE